MNEQFAELYFMPIHINNQQIYFGALFALQSSRIRADHGASKKKKRHGRSWLAGFEAPKCTFCFFPFSYISDSTKLIKYMFGTVGGYSNHQNKHFSGFGVLGVIFGDFLKISQK